MSGAQWIQDAWNRQSKWLKLLRPLSWVYQVGFVANRSLYEKGIKQVYQAPVPVMVIGNITVGGSGKTPLLIQLVQYLQAQGVAVGVISRGYGGNGPFPAEVFVGAEPEVVGDEPALIVQATGVPMVVGPSRKQSIETLLKKYPLDLIISDDGLQHWALARQIEWIVLDQNRGLGNQKLLPEGYLREPVDRLKTGTVIEHTDRPNTPYHMHLEIRQPYLLNAQGQEELNLDQHFYAVVGIGFPKRFYQTLENLGLKYFECHEYPDHHDYEIDDLQFDDAHPIITTEKDAVKILPLLRKHPDFKRPIWVVPVEAVLSAECYTLLNQQLLDVGLDIHKG